MTAWRPAVILAASFCDLAAGAVAIWWSLPGNVGGLLFAVPFLAAGVALLAATFRGSVRLLVAASVLTVIGELVPPGGLLATAILHQRLLLGAGALSIAATAAVLMGDRFFSHST